MKDSRSTTVILGSVQPAYLAWIPFFQRMLLSDVFVYLDDVEFSKNSPHNRNKIKTVNGPLMLTVPVKYAGNSSCTISEMPLDNKSMWQKKHWRTIEMSYSKAPFYKDFAQALFDNVYSHEWKFLGGLNIAILETVRQYLAIHTRCFRSSDLKIGLKNNDKLVEMCKQLGCNSFLVKPGTDDYHPRSFFAAHGIGMTYFAPSHNIYPQLYGEFTRGMSIIDLVMNCGPEQSRQLLYDTLQTTQQNSHDS